MGLKDLQTASIKSSTGQTVDFEFEDIVTSVDNKTSVFELANGDGTYIQSRGKTSLRLPMNCIFSGVNYEDASEAFLNILLTPGISILTHPIYDSVNVIPISTIERTDALKTAANQVVYRVEFWETIDINEEAVSEETAYQALDNLNEASYLSFEASAELGDPKEQANFRYRVLEDINSFKTQMKAASEKVEAVQKKIENQSDSILRGVDSLVGDPLSLAMQTLVLIGEPRRTKNLMTDKLKAYKNLSDIILEKTFETTVASINDFHLKRITCQAIIANIAVGSIENTEWETKNEFLEAAEELSAIFDSFRLWYDNSYDDIESTTLGKSTNDVGSGILELKKLIAICIKNLITKSLQAKTEIRYKLASVRTALDLCYELYGSLDWSVFDKFVRQNSIVCNEFHFLPRGREIVYYI